ncbi:MAG: AI-2E family transporter [Mycobacteriales bacterium]
MTEPDAITGPDEEAPAERADNRAVEEQVDEVVEERVEGRVDEVLSQAGASADRAQQAETGAIDACDGAEQARAGAVQAGRAAVDAARVVAPDDDPLLDTAVRKLEANADDDNPYGTPGRPLSARSPFRLAFTAAMGVALAYGLVQAIVAVRSILILLLTAAFLAIGLNPAVQALERRKVKRGRAVGIVLLGMLMFFVGFGFAVVPPIVDQAQAFTGDLPRYVQQLQDNERIASLDQRFGLLDQVQSLLGDPQQLGVTAAGGVLGVSRVVFNAFFSVLTVLILTLYFLSSLPTIKANAYRLVPRSRRARVGLLSDEILSRVGGYVAGAASIATLAGFTTFLLLLVLGVSYPLALAMLVAITGLIPLVGATIGAAVVTLVALFTSVQAGIICAVYYLIYQQVENYVLYPRIMQRSVDVSPAATVVAVLIGGSLLGVLGALLAIPMAAATQLMLNEVLAPRQDNA